MPQIGEQSTIKSTTHMLKEKVILTLQNASNIPKHILLKCMTSVHSEWFQTQKCMYGYIYKKNTEKLHKSITFTH